MSELNTKELRPDSDVTIPRLRMGETGWTGLKISSGIIKEQRRRELAWPKAIETYKCMAEDATISAAISLMEMMLQKVEWDVTVDDDADEKTKQRAKFIKTCMTDMEHDWSQFVSEISSAYTYGFCISEKVFRRRLRINGSRYNDGLVGIRKLPIRSQDSIFKWEFSEDGRDLAGVWQAPENQTGRYTSIAPTGNIFIPRYKFLLFRSDVKKDNPEGNSPLNGVYNAWKYRTTLEETEAINLVGV